MLANILLSWKSVIPVENEYLKYVEQFEKTRRVIEIFIEERKERVVFD